MNRMQNRILLNISSLAYLPSLNLIKETPFFFQIKVFGRKIKETMPARYLIKVMRALVLRDWQSLDE